jgi:hypothetical protein
VVRYFYAFKNIYHGQIKGKCLGEVCSTRGAHGKMRKKCSWDTQRKYCEKKQLTGREEAEAEWMLGFKKCFHTR